MDNLNPYVGLRPFETDESLLFFGRNDQSMELLQRLHKNHFVAVVGSSGCGKSSLLRAGLIPSLKAGYLVEDSDHWFISIMKPGKNPIYNLVESLLKQLEKSTEPKDIATFVTKVMEEGADAILEILKPLKAEKNVNYFLLVDQFEELFRFSMEQGDAAKKDEAIDFVNIMLELVEQTEIPMYVVITMRSDFIGDCTQFYGLPEAMNKSQYLVPRLTRQQLKTVIEGPAKLFNGTVNPTLTSRLLNDLGKVKDELPLLQHALMRVWESEMNESKTGELDVEDYEKIGGLDKALSNHADEALHGLNENEIQTTKEMFQALTAIDDNGRKIRRPALLTDLCILTETNEKTLLEIIDLFIKDRRSFLIVNKTGDTGEKIVDISHESLIRQWETLSNWVDEEGESVANYKQLAEATNLFEKKKKDLLGGSELQMAVEWRDSFNPTEVWAKRYKQGNLKNSLAYLKSSEDENTRILNREISRKKKQRNLTYSIFALLTIIAIGGMLLINSWSTEERKKKDQQILIIQNEAKNDSISNRRATEEKLKIQSALIKANTSLIAMDKAQLEILYDRAARFKEYEETDLKNRMVDSANRLISKRRESWKNSKDSLDAVALKQYEISIKDIRIKISTL
jgi:energy-coupling factor transporter ATP-binding protein EcfA2